MLTALWIQSCQEATKIYKLNTLLEKQPIHAPPSLIHERDAQLREQIQHHMKKQNGFLADFRLVSRLMHKEHNEQWTAYGNNIIRRY